MSRSSFDLFLLHL